jgi:hypothetical protein
VGIVTKVFKDENEESEITICYQDRLGETPYKGYLLADVTIEDFSPDEVGGNLSKKDVAYLLKVFLPGQRIEFQTEVSG